MLKAQQRYFYGVVIGIDPKTGEQITLNPGIELPSHTALQNYAASRRLIEGMSACGHR